LKTIEKINFESTLMAYMSLKIDFGTNVIPQNFNLSQFRVFYVASLLFNVKSNPQYVKFGDEIGMTMIFFTMELYSNIEKLDFSDHQSNKAINTIDDKRKLDPRNHGFFGRKHTQMSLGLLIQYAKFDHVNDALKQIIPFNFNDLKMAIHFIRALNSNGFTKPYNSHEITTVIDHENNVTYVINIDIDIYNKIIMGNNKAIREFRII